MKFKTEKASIEYFCERLESSGFTAIRQTQSLNQFSYYDISATYRGKTYHFELKRRNSHSSKYGDSVIEYHKFQHFVDDISNGYITNGFVVSFFNDIYTIDIITHNHTIKFKEGAATTEFENKEIKKKVFVCYSQEKKFNYTT